MCGIAGAFLPDDRASLEVQLRAMAMAQRHRGPDGEGVWQHPAQPLGFAHRRLSIIDLSEAGRQPMASGSGRFIACFNGEIYNYRELSSELRGLGHVFRGHSDTEVLLAAVEQWGLAAAVQRFIGMFAFALWDAEEQAVFLVRDRVGVKPLYFVRQAKSFAFASELKALRRASTFRLVIDPVALSLFARYGYIPAPFAIFRDVRKVLPGTIVRLDLKGGGAVATRY